MDGQRPRAQEQPRARDHPRRRRIDRGAVAASRARRAGAADRAARGKSRGGAGARREDGRATLARPRARAGKGGSDRGRGGPGSVTTTAGSKAEGALARRVAPSTRTSELAKGSFQNDVFFRQDRAQVEESPARFDACNHRWSPGSQSEGELVGRESLPRDGERPRREPLLGARAAAEDRER